MSEFKFKGVFNRISGKLVSTSYSTFTTGQVQFYDFTQSRFKRLSLRHFNDRYEVKDIKQKRKKARRR